jgi:hypothetical protein
MGRKFRETRCLKGILDQRRLTINNYLSLESARRNPEGLHVTKAADTALNNRATQLLGMEEQINE